ncbi:hypothetical protein TRVA0_030S01816 [Trichomonascus vanleenenianus]|uniref:uncharacterized protein n=1 Tax=Trichomonascus vanleenenianus TaxID=2268995 RepID=UPI003ECA68D8
MREDDTLVFETTLALLDSIHRGDSFAIRQLLSPPVLTQFEVGDSVSGVIKACCKGVAADIANRVVRQTGVSISPENSSFYYRRITRSRLQALHCMPETKLAFVYESTSLFSKPLWQLRRIRLIDDEDEEYYWKNWESSLERAESCYSARKPTTHHDFDNILNLRESLETAFSGDAKSRTSSRTASIDSIMTVKSEPTRHPLLLHAPQLETTSTTKWASSLPQELAFKNEEDDYWNQYDDYL